MSDNPTYERFNIYVKGWANKTRRGMIENIRDKMNHKAKDSKNRKTPKLARSISVRFKKSYGAISIISFSFARHGLFISYGLGRGYVREGNKVKRGRRYAGDEILMLLHRGYTRKEIGKMRHHYEVEQKEKQTKQREPIDWFDTVIREGTKEDFTGMKWLAEYAGDLYGQKAMEQLLNR